MGHLQSVQMAFGPFVPFGPSTQKLYEDFFSLHNIENVTLQFYNFRAFGEIGTVTDPKQVLIQASWENLCDIQPRLFEFAALTSSLVTSDPYT